MKLQSPITDVQFQFRNPLSLDPEGEQIAVRLAALEQKAQETAYAKLTEEEKAQLGRYLTVQKRRTNIKSGLIVGGILTVAGGLVTWFASDSDEEEEDPDEEEEVEETEEESETPTD